MTVTLRPYQEQFVSDLRDAYKSGAKSVLGVAPTGSGKTVCFTYMAEQAQKRKLRVGIIAHRVELLGQISRSLSDFSVPHGFIAPGLPANPFAYVQVCSVRSVANRIERFRANPFDFLIVDEAHHAAGGSSWHQVISCHRGKRVLGVTATPQRLSGEPLSQAFDSMVMGPTCAELIDSGALSKYRAFAPSNPDLHGVGRRMGDFVRAESEAAMDKPTITGNAVQTYLRLAKGKRAVVFCVSVLHAEHVAAQFRANGVSSLSLDGTMAPQVRHEALRKFSAGEIMALTSCDLISEGLDIPAIEAAILLRPTQSLALHLQQVGRALRPFPGKPHALILDHAGNLARHGLPDDDREWSLDGIRRGPGKPGEASIGAMTCMSCFGVFRAFLACPECGAVRDIEGRKVEEVDGELQEVDLEAVKAAQTVQRKKEEREARTLEDLINLGKSRGYRNPHAWAAMRIHFREAAKNGTYPHGARNRISA